LFLIESIGEKLHFGSCHTNDGAALKHPFSFHSQAEETPDKLVRLQILYPQKLRRIEGGLILLVQRQFVEDKLSNSSRSLSNNRYDFLDLECGFCNSQNGRWPSAARMETPE
jgi:hypothetical protein